MKAFGLLVAVSLAMSGCTIQITSPQVDTRVRVNETPGPLGSIDDLVTSDHPGKPIGDPEHPDKPGKKPRPVKPVGPIVYPEPIHSVAPIPVPSYAAAIATVKGHVHDADGQRIEAGVTVKARSLNPNYPYEGSCDVIGGSYVMNDVPAGVQLEFIASGAGYTDVRRVETLLPQGFEHAGNTLNFGGEKTEADPVAPAFALYWLEDDYEVPPEDEERAFGIRGSIFGAEYDYLPGATVTVRSLHPDFPYESKVESINGDYEFNDVPPGVPISITVSLPGYATQSRIEIVKPPHYEGTNENTNVFDFGGELFPDFAMVPLQQALTTYVKGQVCDESGAGLGQAKVQVLSLNPEHRFLATIPVINGHYAVSEVPAGVQMEITVLKEGYQTSSRVVVLEPLESPTIDNVVNFGCAADAADAAAGEFVLKK